MRRRVNRWGPSFLPSSVGRYPYRVDTVDGRSHCFFGDDALTLSDRLEFDATSTSEVAASLQYRVDPPPPPPLSLCPVISLIHGHVQSVERKRGHISMDISPSYSVDQSQTSTRPQIKNCVGQMSSLSARHAHQSSPFIIWSGISAPGSSPACFSSFVTRRSLAPPPCFESRDIIASRLASALCASFGSAAGTCCTSM